MSAMYFRPVVTYPTRCVAPAFFTRPAPVSHQIVPLFSLFDDSLTQLDNHLRQVQSQFKRPFNPKFDVKETQESYSVEGELPGFDAKDISIEFLDDGHTLQIKGKTVKETKQDAAPAKAVEGSTESTEQAIADAPATAESETSSVKSLKATVEDGVEEPANSSAANDAEQLLADLPKSESTPSTSEQQVVQQPQASEPVKTTPASQEPESKQWVSERYTGSFTRSFKFPYKVDQEAVRASLKDGILAITLPFARKPESRKIQIE